jgi:hypothetical protein
VGKHGARQGGSESRAAGACVCLARERALLRAHGNFGGETGAGDIQVSAPHSSCSFSRSPRTHLSQPRSFRLWRPTGFDARALAIRVFMREQ